MNYDDELERARAKRSRKRTSETAAATRATAANHANQTVQSANSARATYRRRKKKNKARKILLIVVLVLFAVIAAAGFGIYKYFDNKVESMDQVDFKVPEVQNLNLTEEKREQMEKGFLTVAVFGVDSRDNSLGKGNQSDVIMIANLNRETGEIKLVSVFRDTYLNVSDKNTYNKINAAYASGGPEAAVKAINKNLDLNITHYATFNWKAVATVINILGGVEVDISKSEFYYINAFITETVKGTGIGSVQLKAPGVHNLDGVQAVAYGRLRLMDSDYARTERQRIILTKAFEKLKKADLTTLNSVVGHVMEMSSTNIKWEELLSLAGGISKYHLGETTGFPAARGEAKIKIGSNKLSCVIPQTLESNVISLHNFLFGEENYEPSATVKEISAKIAHVSGLATEAEEIGSVAVDQGYIPKPTTTAAASAETKKESETGSTEETSATETAEASGEGESESTAEGESESTGEGESEFIVESGEELRFYWVKGSNARHCTFSIFNGESEVHASGTLTNDIEDGSLIHSMTAGYVFDINTVNGAQMRVAVGRPQGLRFVSRMGKTEGFHRAVSEYGTVLIPTESLDDGDINNLVIGKTMANGHEVCKVEAKTLYGEDENEVVFTAVITNIAEKNYTRAYTARAYAILSDGSVVYGESFASRSIYQIAKLILEDETASEAEITAAQAIVDVVEKYGDNDASDPWN